MTQRELALVVGVSYLVIFVTAIYANFFVLETLLKNPVETVIYHTGHIRLGVMAFLIAAVFDVFVAWALFEFYKDHIFSRVSTYFRVMHATIMGLAVFSLLETLSLTSGDSILSHVNTFNTLWLIGLFFFGVHLLLLSRITRHLRLISIMLAAAGVMYIVDTVAHFLMPNYSQYATIFLTLVAIPSIFGEMMFGLWMLLWGGKKEKVVK